jgi:zinc protease
MIKLCEKFIASLPNTPSMNQWIDPQVVRPDAAEKMIHKGQDERCIVYLTWFVPGPHEFNEKKNQTAAILSEYLDIVLSDEIRENMGGVYSISSRASVSVIPKGEYQLGVYFQCNPQRADELISAVIDCIMEIYNKPLNPVTFEKAKEALLMQHENQIQRNLHIVQSFTNSSVLYNTPLARLYQRPDVIREVKPEDVQALCRDILTGGVVKLILYPEEWQ